MLGGVVDLSVSIDAVIFDDGAFIGDNKTWYLEGRRGLIQAELDFRRSLKELDAASLSDTEIIERLIESLPNERPHLVPPKSSGEHFSSGQEAYNFIYLATEHNLREDLEHRQQMNRSVGEILGSYRMRNESDYRELRRIAND